MPMKSLLINNLSFLQLGEHLSFLSIPLMGAFVVGGVALGALASYLCVRQLNDGYAGSQG